MLLKPAMGFLSPSHCWLLSKGFAGVIGAHWVRYSCAFQTRILDENVIPALAFSARQPDCRRKNRVVLLGELAKNPRCAIVAGFALEKICVHSWRGNELL